MRITDPQVILNGEQDLIASVQRDLDLDAVKDLLKERLTASALLPKGGRIVVHDNNVAFRLDYEINLNGSLLFDRDGNLLEDSESTAPKQNLQAENDDASKSNLDENLSINLPDYDDIADKAPGETQPVDLEPENLSDDIPNTESGLEVEDLKDESAFDLDDPDIIEAEDSNELIDELPKEDDVEDLSVDEPTDIGLENGDRETGEDMDDDDINDLLQESRNFWENKKE
ncbi:hypothetical protein DO021_19245 [Desulfobacter hydrogenophilus]|uniref:Uncharacterized protein n=1 Tax=Desulfobacter hydrogenophilus TaxID=2291 RepID=A0A328F782_9BACT|nr:hypothetical protein [Desulfobacter hydrogenophilus]NDY74263.1 hypothetical protein [Desulfobacter hydrogenophilus]QBH14595.1 hypothetical protein EYB58_17690 [Desulfobacter hydrogenophilus]RAM00418.1 hypothetical protein DO021_19245 [Desulfobacter hydrogenophilus]